MADQKTFKLVITKIDSPVFDGSAISVTVPGSTGEMTLLSGHEPLISPLKEGTITVRSPMSEEKYQITSGMLECSNNQVTILI
jgi:F-type H+-transporting ATPase subunit epsilon